MPQTNQQQLPTNSSSIDRPRRDREYHRKQLEVLQQLQGKGPNCQKPIWVLSNRENPLLRAGAP